MKCFLSRYIVHKDDIENFIDSLPPLRDTTSSYVVTVAAKEFVVGDKVSLESLKKYLTICVERKFVPWVVVFSEVLR